MPVVCNTMEHFDDLTMEIAHTLSSELSLEASKSILDSLEAINKYILHQSYVERRHLVKSIALALEAGCDMVVDNVRETRRQERESLDRACSMMGD